MPETVGSHTGPDMNLDALEDEIDSVIEDGAAPEAPAEAPVEDAPAEETLPPAEE